VEVQVDGDEEEVIVEDVHVLGPVAHGGVPARQQLRVEVGVHRVHLAMLLTNITFREGTS